ncbi:hypothetical protein PV04_07725 [Phialophora macrospora]|uniref:Uncharacterized protein n=1 Tax=Phialophora macrospora TaxID=1851006 RepID=A0A0D2DTP0_9EURO|nr:hypothetical protein PV04_07725 [Phialophora macrospora]
MDGNHFLRLTPEEGRPHVFKPTGGAVHKFEGQNPALRRVSGIADLKTNVDKHVHAPPLPKFLKLTPDAPKTTVGKASDKSGLQPSPGEPACKSSGKKRSASISGHEVATTEHNEMQHHGYNKTEIKLGGSSGGGNEGAHGTNAH